MKTITIPEAVFHHHFWGSYAETILFAFSPSQNEQAETLLASLNQMEFSALVPDPCGGRHKPKPFAAQHTPDGRFLVVMARLAGDDIRQVRERIMGEKAMFKNSIDKSALKNVEFKL